MSSLTSSKNFTTSFNFILSLTCPSVLVFSPCFVLGKAQVVPIEYVIPYAVLLDMLLHNACFLNTNPSVIVQLNLIWVQNIMWIFRGGGRVKVPAVILHLVAAVLEWTILPSASRTQNKLHFKGSMLLLLESVSVVPTNTFCIDLSSHPPQNLYCHSFQRGSHLKRYLQPNKDFTKWLEDK